MEINNSHQEDNQSGRKFIQQSAVLGGGVILPGTTGLFASGHNSGAVRENQSARFTQLIVINRLIQALLP